MALEGSLRDMSLVDLIRIFRMGSKTGVLKLVGGAERGVVYVSEGSLVDAVLVRGPERQMIATAEDAVICLLQWEDATFTFQHDLSVHQRPARIIHDGEWLVLEGLRRRAHPLQAPATRPRITLDTRLQLAALPGGAESGVNLDLDQWRILSQVAVSENVRDICAKTGMEPELAIRTLSELVAIGFIEIAHASPPSAPLLALPAPLHSQQRLPPRSSSDAAPAATNAARPTLKRRLLNAIVRRIREL
jgi:hypothetical protein